MELKFITLQVAFASQPISTIEIHNSSTVLEALTMAEVIQESSIPSISISTSSKNALSLEAYDYFTFFKGKLLNPFMSLHSYGVRNNSKICVAIKRRKDGSRAKKFLESMKSSNSQSHITMEINKKRHKFIAEKRVEVMRLYDLTFNSWEGLKVFPKMLDDIFKAQEMQYTSPNTDSETNLDFMSEISEDPLPYLGIINANDRNINDYSIENN